MFREKIIILKAVFGMAFTFCFVALPAVVLAGDGPLDEALLGFFTNTVMPLIAALVMGLAALALRWLGAKFKTDVFINNKAFIDAAVKDGIGLAEEWAAKKLKNTKNITTGKEKMDIAVASIIDAVPKLTLAKAQVLVDSMLARLPGVGASKDVNIGG